MKVLVIGATGDVGKAVADAFAERHEALRASRNAPDANLRVDIADPASIKGLYERVGMVDAVVCCAGSGRFGPLQKLTDDDFAFTIANKLMGQVNVVRFGIDHVRDGGVFLLTADGKGTIRLLPGFTANKSPGTGGKVAMKTEALIGATAVDNQQDIFVISQLGKIIRFQAAEVPAKEGVVQGVNCMGLRADGCTALASCTVAQAG